MRAGWCWRRAPTAILPPSVREQQPMTDSFETALWKVDRDRKHADDLEAEVGAFWATDPYEVETVGAPLTSGGSYRVKRITPLPESIPLIAGDAAHNIRAALDHFAWSAVAPQERGVQTCFPIWNSAVVRTPDRWRKQVERQLKGASVQLIDAATNLEPRQSGRDSLLWAIHELDRVDKHRLLLSVAVALTRIGFDGESYDLTVVKKFSGANPAEPLFLEPIKWTPVEEGTVLFSAADGFDFGAIGATMTFEMMLGEPEMLREQSAVTHLRILAELTVRCVPICTLSRPMRSRKRDSPPAPAARAP